jgi:hypothetical protein
MDNRQTHCAKCGTWIGSGYSDKKELCFECLEEIENRYVPDYEYEDRMDPYK